MAFDTATRNELQKLVGRARDLLVEEFTSQCQGVYGIQPDGSALDISALAYLSTEELTKAELLRDRVEHLAAGIAGSKKRAEAVSRLVREQAFTVLNRLCALRMCEERGLVLECVRNGYDSKGFRLYDQAAAKLGGDTFERYSLFIQLLFDELAVDLGVLFDRFSLYGLLFPREAALKDIMALINTSTLKHIWAEDEAIGWVYQYFNSQEERQAMRKASAVPRNSRELAVRNQFFTPRYVVEFLTDNTLGRIWYEMRNGDTSLKETCRYLVRRPSEIFLGPDETAPGEIDDTSNLSEEEKLKLPVYIKHREKKDPRDLKILDPACGSGHFLLYAFDLLAIIYREAWEDPESPDSEVTGATLREDFAALAELEAAVPELILRWNLYGIDIDRRAAQIAALSLWLRAQKAWQEQSIKTPDRARVKKSHIVCSEPMPGEKEVLRDFSSRMKPTVLGQLVEVVFDKMQLAGEAGSLLRIEEEIQSAIEEARRQWQSGPKPEQVELFPDLAQPKQGEIQFDLKGVTREFFWSQAEERILKNLQAYASEAEGEEGLGHRLFAEDAAQGFAFIDLCRNAFDVVLMNPPFGAASAKSKTYFGKAYPRSKNDLLAASVERGLRWLHPGGRLGAITSRTCFFLTTFKNWRLNVVLDQSRIHSIADLGQGVMDDAMVEAAAYVLEKSSPTPGTTVFRAIADTNRQTALQDSIDAHNRAAAEDRLFLADQAAFQLLPDSPFVYWIGEELIRRFKKDRYFEPNIGVARNGMTTGDDFRWVRAVWEVSYADTIFCYYPLDGSGFCCFDDPIVEEHRRRINQIQPNWGFFIKAGSSQPWYSPITLKVNWARDGYELKNFRNAQGKPRAFLRSRDLYYRPGFSWTRRAVRFYPYIVPTGCIPSVSRYMAFPDHGLQAEAIGVCASRVASAFLRFYAEFWQRPNFLVDTLKMLPWPDLAEEAKARFDALIAREVRQRRLAYQNHEPFHEFLVPVKIRDFSQGGQALAFDPGALLDDATESMVAEAFGFTPEEARAVERDLLEAIAYQRGITEKSVKTDLEKPTTEAATGDGSNKDAKEESDSDFVLDYSTFSVEEAHVSYLVGCAFGRWDIRYATGERQAPELPTPFAPLPICPPGLLQGENGLPPSPEAGHRLRTEDRYRLDVPWDGILVDDPENPLDIEHRVHDALAMIWGHRAGASQQEACELLGVKTLREWFRRPAAFFAHHLKRYSKSRRKAPIYWPLSTASNSYTLWIYYPRLTDQTLYSCVNLQIDPKLQEIEQDLFRLLGGTQADSKTQKRIDALVELQQELKYMREELLRVAKLPYKPDQNDGVLITAAPLWRLFRHKPWQKELKKCWDALEAGKYDWARLAYAIWPDRVREVCNKDKSIAIAHGLEDLYGD